MSTGTTPRIVDNRYILDEDWREGGMARVYRAVDRRNHQTVAVKVLARELNPDERLLNRVFDGERRSLERLKHPNRRVTRRWSRRRDRRAVLRLRVDRSELD
jgi:serine/threonine protein kinase